MNLFFCDSCIPAVRSCVLWYVFETIPLDLISKMKVAHILILFNFIETLSSLLLCTLSEFRENQENFVLVYLYFLVLFVIVQQLCSYKLFATRVL